MIDTYPEACPNARPRHRAGQPWSQSAMRRFGGALKKIPGGLDQWRPIRHVAPHVYAIMESKCPSYTETNVFASVSVFNGVTLPSLAQSVDCRQLSCSYCSRLAMPT
jgi:hypothetical protein